MCSIIGIGFQKNHTISDKQMVSKLVTKLLINGMLRGKTATGLCYVSNKEVVIVKNKLNAKNFTETEFYKDSYDNFRNVPVKTFSRKYIYFAVFPFYYSLSLLLTGAHILHSGCLLLSFVLSFYPSYICISAFCNLTVQHIHFCFIFTFTLCILLKRKKSNLELNSEN